MHALCQNGQTKLVLWIFGIQSKVPPLRSSLDIFLGYKDNDSWNKVHIFWEGHKILQNLHSTFDWHYMGQIYGGDVAKFCGLLRMYEL